MRDDMLVRRCCICDELTDNPEGVCVACRGEDYGFGDDEE